jgi:hypothetical protein
MASNINADPIDANYPIAGTNNSTQGFRDNFANIKNNLNYAKSELSDLQSKAILKSALNGQSLKNDFSETVISNVTLRSAGTVINDLGATSGTIVLDFSVSTHYLLSTADSVSLTFTDWPTSGICGAIRLVVKINSTDHILTIPGSVSKGLTNIAGLVSSTINGLSIKPPVTIVSVTNPTTYTVSSVQTVGSSANPVTFTGTSTTGTTAVFLGYISGTTLTVTSVTSGTIAANMTLADSSGLGSSTITFAVTGDYVFDFETIDHGTSILIMDQSRASNVANVSYTPSTLLPAQTNRLGGIKVGTGLNVTSDGILSPKIASGSVAGVIKIGTGLTIAADGTLSVSGSGSASPAVSPVGVLSNDSLIFGAFVVDRTDDNSNPLTVVGINTWTNMGISLRIPANGSYRFRAMGALFRYDATGFTNAGMLRIYINGVNSSAADMTFPPANLRLGISSGYSDFYRDITGLSRGDKVELYYQWSTPWAAGQQSPVGIASFSVFIAGENNFGIHALSDYSIKNSGLANTVVGPDGAGSATTPGQIASIINNVNFFKSL